MATYMNVTFNHFAMIQRWVGETGASATLDLKDLNVEVKHKGRYYTFYPIFQAKVNDRLVHLNQLTSDVRGFGGWRPYRTITHTHSSNKTLFKQRLLQAGLRTPSFWSTNDLQASQHDFVVKASNGSFGRGLFGPFRAGVQPRIDPAQIAQYQELYAEQFVRGKILKVWYWGARPFFAHVDGYPIVEGDGTSSLETLLRRRLEASQMDWDTHDGAALSKACLAYQGVELHDTLPRGQEVWFDFRYGQTYPTTFGSTASSDNSISDLQAASGDQLRLMGQCLSQLLKEYLPAPVLITADGVLDEQGQIWWLEMNTNSLMPPEGYRVMFENLFA